MNGSLKQQIIASTIKRGAKTWYSIYMDVEEMDVATVKAAINQLVAEGAITEINEPEIHTILYGPKEARMNIMSHSRVLGILDQLEERLKEGEDEFERVLDRVEEAI
jgi:hypothetical protein